MTPDQDPWLAARALTPADPDLARAWQHLVRGLEVGWLDDPELLELAQHLITCRDFGVEELSFAHLGRRLRVSLLDDRIECDRRAFCLLVTELIARRASEPLPPRSRDGGA